MEAKATLISWNRDYRTKKWQAVFEVDKPPADDLNGDLRLTVKKWREKRSLDANALFWKCVGDIAAALGSDKWSIYLKLLRRYGEYTYICVKPQAVEAVKANWRETEIVGDIDINGKPAVQMLCYYGSSQYDTAQFSRLLNGTISDMEQMGIETPSEQKLRESLELWEKQYGNK